VRLYEVQPGDSPASIAAQDAHAGCPKCSIDLIRSNPHKPTVRHPNGFVTFKEIFVGEKLRLPEKWFSGELDRLPKSYFENLPHHDGTTGVGVGAEYQVDIGPAEEVYPLVLVSAAQRAYAVMDADPDYCSSVARVGSSVNSAVHAFKSAWNSSQSPLVPINTGNYERQTADALLMVLGHAPVPCGTRTYTAPAPAPEPTPTIVASTEKKQLSTGAVVGISLAVAGVVGGAVHLLTNKPKPRKRHGRQTR
jgi:hypothetical protein